MKVGVIIPDRTDRPLFLENCRRMINNQTLQPEVIRVVDYPAVNDDYDITPRCREGYNYLSKEHDLDIIAIMENDDWYSPSYLETMIEAWLINDKPDLFGTCYTIYYHIGLKAYYTMDHHQRASLMNTLIKPRLKFDWCVDNEPYLDLHLWSTIRDRKIFRPDKHIAVGIKHGIGKCGGGSHVIDERIIKRYHTADDGFLFNTLDHESFKFYNNYFENGNLL